MNSFSPCTIPNEGTTRWCRAGIATATEATKTRQHRQLFMAYCITVHVTHRVDVAKSLGSLSEAYRSPDQLATQTGFVARHPIALLRRQHCRCHYVKSHCRVSPTWPADLRCDAVVRHSQQDPFPLPGPCLVHESLLAVLMRQLLCHP